MTGARTHGHHETRIYTQEKNHKPSKTTMNISLRHSLLLSMALASVIPSCVVGPPPPRVAAVGYYDALPAGYDEPYYYYGNRYYYGGVWQTGRFFYGGRYHDGRYFHNGHYFYGGRFHAGHVHAVARRHVHHP